MIELNQKQKIILKHIDGISNREIAKEFHMSKDTVNKYVNEYEEKKKELIQSNPGIDRTEIIHDIVEKPKYDSSNRKPIKVTDEINQVIEECLESNRKKRAAGRRKQVMKKIDIHEELLNKGYEISYSTVKRLVDDTEQRHREAFIRQEYEPGQICEFDWGDVKLNIGGTGFKKYQMAVFTPANSNYRFAELFMAQDTPAFQQSHADFFAHSKGAFHTMVYDNMRVAVKNFVGLYEKEPTKALTKLSLYYGFSFRFCNIASGNEKGHVEKSVDYIRRKAFGNKSETFDSLADANRYLLEICQRLNMTQIYNGCIPMEVFEEEKANLLPNIPPFESCTVSECRVDKYSTITCSQNHYSVPDDLVGKILKVRAYTDKIIVYNENIMAAVHKRSYLPHDWQIELKHYLKTLYKKPGALTHSTALQQADTKTKNIFDKYYSKDARTFLQVLEIIYEKGVDVVYDALRELEIISPFDMGAEKVRTICDRAKQEKNSTVHKYTDPISIKSRGTLSIYNSLAAMQIEKREAV